MSDAGESFSGDMPSFSDTVFGFLDENYPLSDESLDEREWRIEEEEEEENSGNFEEKKAFWDEQANLIQGILCRTSSIETRVRNATKQGLREVEGGGERKQCGCGRAVVAGGKGWCRDCSRREICEHLRNAGFDSSIRKSKWKNSPEIPSGEHTYIEVVDKSTSHKGEVRVVIELNFKAEFEMARASQEYNHLISRLPEIYVGKPERLKNLIKVLCGAAKKCMKEKKMHLPPWRKHKYMQAKWLGSYSELVITTTTANPLNRVMAQYPRSAKPRASMLTLSLLDELPGAQRQAVAVV